MGWSLAPFAVVGRCQREGTHGPIVRFQLQCFCRLPIQGPPRPGGRHGPGLSRGQHRGDHVSMGEEKGWYLEGTSRDGIESQTSNQEGANLMSQRVVLTAMILLLSIFFV